MKHLAFVTDGAIDLRSFTTFGFNSKPNTTSPIGFFGTGLKISVAVIARLGCKMTVLIDGVEHEFYTKTTDFRGKSFEVVNMRKRKGLLSRWTYQQMPFTTELGKNWESWQVFRELESNTRDEGGYTVVIEDEDNDGGLAFMRDNNPGKTVIIVHEPSIVKCFEEKDTIFLPEDLELRTKNSRCEAYNVGSEYLFYRGMRVMKFDKPSAFTYNITAEQRLTEDRTLYSWNAQWEVRQLIMESTDYGFVDQILKLEEDKFWESRIEFDDAYAISSETFRSTISQRKRSGGYVLPRALSFYDRYNVSEPVDPDITITFRRSEWRRISQVLDLVDTPTMAQDLSWALDDGRFEPFNSLLEQLREKAPIGEAVEFTPEKVEIGDSDVPF